MVTANETTAQPENAEKSMGVFTTYDKNGIKRVVWACSACWGYSFEKWVCDCGDE
jgi:hypothetical protein